MQVDKCEDTALEDRMYSVWREIIKRSTEGSYKQSVHPWYVGCTICNEWKIFDNFRSWYLSQIGYNLWYEVDKDLLIKGNKHYSPQTCLLLPKFINGILTTSRKARGSLPIGVYYDNKIVRYVARCRYVENGIRKRKTVGYFHTLEDAFKAYKDFKEAYIKRVADEYKENISEKAYNALISFSVNIED